MVDVKIIGNILVELIFNGIFEFVFVLLFCLFV